MVTTRFARSAVPLATSPLAFTWRFAELFWPDLPAPCGLDAEAARLLRYSLTLAVEQALRQQRKVGAAARPLVAPMSHRLGLGSGAGATAAARSEWLRSPSVGRLEGGGTRGGSSFLL